MTRKGERQSFKHIQDGWWTGGGRRIYMRSSWEKKYAGRLHLLKLAGEIKDWEYEPDTFWFESIKRGVRSYKPDFKVFQNDGSFYYVEVKGYMDAKSKTKLKRMKRYYPDVRIEVVTGARLKGL